MIACFLLCALALAPVTAGAAEPDWDMSIPTEITEEILELFDDSAQKIVGAGYTLVAVLGVYDDVLCLYNHENDNGYTAYIRLSNGAIAEIQLKEAEQTKIDRKSAHTACIMKQAQAETAVI